MRYGENQLHLVVTYTSAVPSADPSKNNIDFVLEIPLLKPNVKVERKKKDETEIAQNQCVQC